MNRRTEFRSIIWMMAAAGAFGCSLMTYTIPNEIQMAAIKDQAVFLPPTNTPFWPLLATKNLASNMFHAALPATDLPAPTNTIVILPTSIETSAGTPTLIIPASVTPTNTAPVYFPPTWTKTRVLYIPPTATKASKNESWPTAAFTPYLSLTPSFTPTETRPEFSPTPSDTGTPTATLSGSETATPTFTETLTPTITPTPTFTFTPTISPTASATATPRPTSQGCATFNFDYEAQVISLLNAERVKAGRRELTLNSILTKTARDHSVDMVVNKYMSHTGSDGSTPKERIARAGFRGNWWGEIIGGGTPAISVNWWMNEPGHRDVIMSEHYTDFGAGYAYCPGQGWFTVDFGGP